MTIKGIHGKVRFQVQRFICMETGKEVSYFDLTDQFRDGYISTRLQELAAYYSNRISYTEVEKLIERLTGTKLLSDEKVQQLVVAKAVEVSHAYVAASMELLEREDASFPLIHPEVDLYDSMTDEVLLFDDGIQVKGQKAMRSCRTSQQQARIASSQSSKRVKTDVVMLQQKNRDYQYICAGIDETGGELYSLEDAVQIALINEYGDSESPLPLVTITDGAHDIRLRLVGIFGASLPIILDWYHLCKKVRELMSMIAWTKEEKRKHLKFLLYHLWHGRTDTALEYLRTEVHPRNAAKLTEFITYLDKHHSEIIDYATRRKVGKVLGSGRVEKGVDQVIGMRQKKKGMSWSKKGSQALGILKVVELNGQWQQLWFAEEK